MRYQGLVIATLAATTMACGCGKSGSEAPLAKGGIAVVDLDKVAIETGRDRQLAQSLKVAENSLNEIYKKTYEQTIEKLNAKKKDLAEDASEEQKSEVAKFERTAVSELSQLQNNVRVKYEQIKQSQIVKFRAELKPIAQEVAAKHGMSIVIPKNEGLLLSVDPGVDITDDVVKVLRDKHPAVTPAAEAPAAAQNSSASRRSQTPAKTAARDEFDTEESAE